MSAGPVRPRPRPLSHDEVAAALEVAAGQLRAVCAMRAGDVSAPLLATNATLALWHIARRAPIVAARAAIVPLALTAALACGDEEALHNVVATVAMIADASGTLAAELGQVDFEVPLACVAPPVCTALLSDCYCCRSCWRAHSWSCKR